MTSRLLKTNEPILVTLYASDSDAGNLWNQVFPHTTKEELHRRFAKAAGDADLKMHVQFHTEPVSGKTCVTGVEVKLCHNSGFDAKKNYIKFRINKNGCHIKGAEFDAGNMGNRLARRYMQEIGALAQEQG